MPNSNGSNSDDKMFNIHLDTIGNGSGDINAIGDYSSIPQTFSMQPPVGKVFVVTEFVIHVTDNSVFSSQNYGGLSKLTNGIIITVEDDKVGVIIQVTNNSIIKTNDDINRLAANFQIIPYGASDQSIVACFSSDSFGVPVSLDGSQNQRIVVLLNDDFSGLISHYFIAHGHE